MKMNKPGKRYSLLLYRRRLTNIGLRLLFLGVALLILWAISWKGILSFLDPNYTFLIAVGGTIAIAFGFFALLARSLAYIQARPGYLHINTPFFPFKIPYQGIRSIHPASFQQLLSLKDLSGSQRRYLQPLAGKTAVLIELAGFPGDLANQKLILPPEMLLLSSHSLVILVPDWMGFSTDLDSIYGQWLQGSRISGTMGNKRILQ